MNSPVNETKRRYEKIAQQLASEIAQGRYAVGQRLPSERDLAQTFQSSRTTIREAIIALELDGLVEVKVGSGVYVAAAKPGPGVAAEHDFGPFEILEARRVVEGETAALAASRIGPEQIEELEKLLYEMDVAHTPYVPDAENADRRFHEVIAESSGNTALLAMVQMLWDARARSPQYQHLTGKARAAGLMPVVNQHRRILEALRKGNVAAARKEMEAHISQVIEGLLNATEAEEIERARAQLEQQRRRYLARSEN